jgi:hypothetical protein
MIIDETNKEAIKKALGVENVASASELNAAVESLSGTVSGLSSAVEGKQALLSTATGYSATGTFVLKCIDGTLTWEEELDGSGVE